MPKYKVFQICERERENENDLSLFIISELAWYHSKKRKKKEEVGSQGVK